MGKEVRLIKVDGGANNNKFYNMKENGDGTFTATYGRVGAAKPQTDTKPMSKWDATYREKTSAKKVTSIRQNSLSQKKLSPMPMHLLEPRRRQSTRIFFRTVQLPLCRWFAIFKVGQRDR